MFEMLTSKAHHLVHIFGTGTLGFVAEGMMQVPNPTQTVAVIQILAQVVIAVVTAYAAIQKALQKPVAQPTNSVQDVQAQ